MSEKLISIIIVNWNGKKWLRKCLDSLTKQTYKNYEIIFVDNASYDGSVKFIKENYPFAKIIVNSKNLGFAGGNNIGFRMSKGEFILLLNNDTWVESNFLKKLIKAFDEIPKLGSVQSKIVLMNNSGKMDLCGSYWTSSSFLYYFGCFKDSSLEIYNKRMPFFSNKGASVMVRREIIEKVGLFDEDFWCYYEETDFCHRVWLSGYECWYYPMAVCHHANGGTSGRFNNEQIQFHNFKNKQLSFLKNFEAKTLVVILPVFFFMNILLSLVWILQGKFKHFLSTYKALIWNIKNIKETLKKRKIVQELRVKSDKEIFKVTKKNPRLSYYYFLFFGLEKYEDK